MKKLAMLTAVLLALSGGLAGTKLAQAGNRFHFKHHAGWNFPTNTPKLTRCRVIAIHDLWMINHARYFPLSLINQHRREFKNAQACIERIRARQRAAREIIPSWPWMALADCESGDGTGTPPYRPLWTYDYDFHGGFNFLVSTWLAMGGGRFASKPEYATPYQQYLIAKRTVAVSGWSQFPVCSRKIGAR